MRLECTRCGPKGRQVTMPDGTVYDFQPNDAGDFTAIVLDEAHRERFLRVETFRVYGKAGQAQYRATLAREEAERAKEAASEAAKAAKAAEDDAKKALEAAEREEEALADLEDAERAKKEEDQERVLQARKRKEEERLAATRTKQIAARMKKNPALSEEQAAAEIDAESAEKAKG